MRLSAEKHDARSATRDCNMCVCCAVEQTRAQSTICESNLAYARSKIMHKGSTHCHALPARKCYFTYFVSWIITSLKLLYLYRVSLITISTDTFAIRIFLCNTKKRTPLHARASTSHMCACAHIRTCTRDYAGDAIFSW